MLRPKSPIFTYQRLSETIFKLRLNTCPAHGASEAPVITLKLFCLLKSINRKQTFLCLGSRAILQPRTWISYFLLLLCLEAWRTAEAVPFFFTDTLGPNKNAAFLPEQANITCISCFRCYSSDYFPMQKSLKMISRISSAPTRPVIRPRLVRANRTPSAARARSMSRYRWYWARAAKHCCRWALWRAWVRVGAPDRGSPHLERKLENKMSQNQLKTDPKKQT